MKQRNGNAANAPTPEQLAAYADGELDAATRSRVAAWLADHADAVAHLEAQRRLDRVWQATSPPEPSEAEWATLLERVLDETRREGDTVTRRRAEMVSARAVPLRRRILGFPGFFWMSGAAAAAVLVALAWQRPPLTDVKPQPEPHVAHLLRVAGDDDVEILSVDAADINFLVVGEPPLRGPFVLAAAGDVVLDSIGPDPVDGMMPWVRMDTTHADGPMIMAPLNAALNREGPSPAPAP